MSSIDLKRWGGEFEPVIGLEVHAQLTTKSKLFCACSTGFNAPINQSICPICAGHPGTLPTLNEGAVVRAAKAGLALNCSVALTSVFSRKNYFYPDLPKGYQISQFDLPLCENGFLEIESADGSRRRIGIQRIHMEEDAGKSVHAAGMSLVNLNRASTPLIEIVSMPEIRTPEEAGDYLRKLRAILMYLEVCDGNMQEGNFRCDANVSVKPIGSSKLGTRAEIKNVNSFRFVEKAIEYEILRQIQVIQSGQKVVQETRSYDSAKNVTLSMRSKEEAHDYRYFPEPDLVPLRLTSEQIIALRKELPELPDQKRERYIQEFGLPPYDAGVITSSKRLALFFEQTVQKCGEPKTVSNWVMGELLRLLKMVEQEVDDLEMNPFHLAQLIQMIRSQELSTTMAKTVFEEMFHTSKDPKTIANEKGLVQISDTAAIAKVIDEVLQENPGQLAQYRSGKDKLFGFFVGQVMKKMSGKANPALINQLLKEKL